MNLIRLHTVVKREVERYLRIPIQTIVSPWISATLYILVFGVVVGAHITDIHGLSYIDFVLPGILMMNLVQSSLGQSSSSLYFQRWVNTIHEMLASPLSYAEMITGYVTGAVSRAVIVASGIFVLALFFTKTTIAHLPLFLFFVLVTATIFSLVGLLVGLWAEKFEHLSILQTFVITPLIYVGGVFNSLSMLPERLQQLARFNPFFYVVDGIRYAMTGFSEGSIAFSVLGLCGVVLLLFATVWVLFHRGWKLRV